MEEFIFVIIKELLKQPIFYIPYIIGVIGIIVSIIVGIYNLIKKPKLRF